MSMLTALKMSSLTCKCVLYRSELNAKGADPMELNFEGLEIKKIPKDRAQSVDEKNGVICLVIRFTPRVMVFKMSDS